MRINKESDFKLIETHEGLEASTPFTFSYFTLSGYYYEARYDGATHTNCKLLEDGSLMIIFDRPRFEPGQLSVRREFFLTDIDFLDGINNKVSVDQLDILIVDGASDEGDATVQLPPAYQQGAPGDSPYIGDNGNWWVGDVDTGVAAAGSIDNLSDEDKQEIAAMVDVGGDINHWELTNSTQSYVSASSPSKTVNTTVDHRSMTHDVEVGDTTVFRLQIWNPNQVNNTVEDVESRIANRFAFYDEGLTKIVKYIDIASLNGSTYQTELIEVPKGAYWVRFGLIMGYSGSGEQTFDEDIKAMISRGENALEYRPSEADFIAEHVDSRMVQITESEYSTLTEYDNILYVVTANE